MTDLNTKAALIMGWEAKIFDCGESKINLFHKIETGEVIPMAKDPSGRVDHLYPEDWSPTTDRNQAVMVLKRMEELGLKQHLLDRISKMESPDPFFRNKNLTGGFLPLAQPT